MSKKPRIPLNTVQGGLNAAFSGLQMEGLAEGPSEVMAPAALLKTPAAGRVILRKEKAGRGGKTVIVVEGFAPHFTAAALEGVAKKLRAACGCGGSVQERTVEMQGDQPGLIRAALEAEGFQVGGIK